MRIGVRELRQHASRYLAMVQRGEVVEVTDRGRLVARLVPATGDTWDELVAAGLIQPAEGDLLDVEPIDLPFSASARLADLRRDER
jgi:prevent-host-death family protein